MIYQYSKISYDNFHNIGTTLHPRQGAACQGQKFRIFLGKAIIDLRHHFCPFLIEDFYIFIFFATYLQENISFNFFVILE